jgi:hypothetical protein
MEETEVRQRLQDQIRECRTILELKKDANSSEEAHELIVRFEHRSLAYSDFVYRAEMDSEEQRHAIYLIRLSRNLSQRKRAEFGLPTMADGIESYLNSLSEGPDDGEGGARVFSYLDPPPPPRWDSDAKPIPGTEPEIEDTLGDARI